MTHHPDDPRYRSPIEGEPMDAGLPKEAYDPKRVGVAYPNWGWVAVLFGLVILGLGILATTTNDTSQTVMNEPAPATTGSAPSPGPNIDSANRGGATR